MDVVTRKIILRKRIYAYGVRGASKRRNDETPERDEKTIVYGPDRFLHDGSVDKSAVRGKCCHLVVSSFRCFAIETEEPSNFKF